MEQKPEARATYTWTPKVCETTAFWALVEDLGP